MEYVLGLKCKGCGKECGKKPVAACEECWAALEPIYDMDARARARSPGRRSPARPRDLWRYRELLPIDGEPTVGRGTGFTPLLPRPRLGERLGIRDLWVKYDAACHPTLSFKDRLVAVALTKAKEFGHGHRGLRVHRQPGERGGGGGRGLRACGPSSSCPRTWKRRRSRAPRSSAPTLVGVRGNYDRVNRLCAQIADRHGWGFVNVNLRAYYGEGSKTVGYELAEQLGWTAARPRGRRPWPGAA